MLEVVDYVDGDLPATHPRRALRDMSMEEFIEKWGSGTLRKSQKLGFNVREAYLKERARFEFGEGFMIIQRSYVAYTDVNLVSCQGMTELGWHAERMIQLRPFESDKFLCKQIDVDMGESGRIVGAGIIVSKTSAKWIPLGYSVFSVVTEFKNGKYSPAINPF